MSIILSSDNSFKNTLTGSLPRNSGISPDFVNISSFILFSSLFKFLSVFSLLYSNPIIFLLLLSLMVDKLVKAPPHMNNMFVVSISTVSFTYPFFIVILTLDPSSILSNEF